MPRTNSTIAPLYGGHTKTTQTVEASDHRPIRDRSANQRALPIEKPARPFVSRCFEVKLPCVSKMVYIALAHRCKVWTEGDTGTTGRIGRSGIAADAGLHPHNPESAPIDSSYRLAWSASSAPAGRIITPFASRLPR